MELRKVMQPPFYFLKGDRDYRFDLLKLWAMLSVVLDHCLQRWIENCQQSQLYNFIFLSQMPIFIFVSGYFAYFQIKKIVNFTPKETIIFLSKKVISLLIPFISYAIIKLIISNNYSMIYESFVYPQKSLWFLWTLLWLEVLIFVSQLISKGLSVNKKDKVKWIFALSLVFYLLLLVPFAVLFIYRPEIIDTKLIVYYSIFFLFGYCFSFLYQQFEFVKKSIFNVAIGIISLIALIVVMILHPTIISDAETIPNIIIRIIGSVSAIIAVFEFVSLLSKIKLFSFVSKFGRISLEFYYVHLLLFMIPIFQVPLTNVFLFICLYLLVVISTFLVIVLLKTNIVTDLLCFGKINLVWKEKKRNVC